jgi:Carboxypeptidase regulatory-like domain
VLSGDRQGTWDVDADIRFDPSTSITTRFSTDRFSQRFNLDWRLFPSLTLVGTYNSLDGVAAGVQTSFSSNNFFTFGRVTLDDKNRWRWNINQHLGVLSFMQQGNEIGIVSELTYNLCHSSFLNNRNSLILSYETRNFNRHDDLAVLTWRYRSKDRASDSRYLWEAQLGYGFGSQGSGLVASLQTSVIPGLLVRGRYEEVSLTSDQPSYSLEIVSSLNLQQGIFAGDRQGDRFRSQGGLLIQPFFDRNNNGKRDTGELAYTQNSDLLLIVNNIPLKSFRPEVQANRILLRLQPGTYRLDLDPSGFPADWQSTIDSLAVEVVAGSYTPIQIPLRRSYTLSGVVTDATGKAIAGVRVEAIEVKSGQRRFSVTNSAGVYYLEQLQQGTYNLQINGQPAKQEKTMINESSEPFQALNLQQL